jgi:catechol 2,3-dioxygenase-like lactoylglutathione lyase family enzyme
MTGWEPTGLTVQLWVADGAAARAWYEKLFGRAPDFRPAGDDTFCEWVVKPGYWEIHVVETDQQVPRQPPLRFGTGDIDAARARLVATGIAAEEIEELPSVVRWCNFPDPWGNRLGIYQDLSRFP